MELQMVILAILLGNCNKLGLRGGIGNGRGLGRSSSGLSLYSGFWNMIWIKTHSLTIQISIFANRSVSTGQWLENILYSYSTCFCWWRRGGHRDGCLRIHGGGGRGLLRWDGCRLPRHKASLALKKIDLDFKCCRFIFREIQPQLWLAERNTSTNHSWHCILR